MKTNFLNYIGIFAFSVMAMSCVDKAAEAETTEAEEVAMTEEGGMEYAVNTANSTIEWKGFKPTGTHYGTVEVEDGTLTIEEGNVVAGTFVIDMNTIVANDLEGEKKANLEAHLMGTVEGKEGDFFNVNQYPTATFEVTGSNEMENGKMMLSGNLTLKDKTNNITIPVTVTDNGDTVTLTSDTFTIDRTKWDVNYGSKS
ncbi:MAG: YceI family protein, partial [Flavobacteriaceae bacterium]|nr:YceI family protein [Flavobacteriaceae bacterium]